MKQNEWTIISYYTKKIVFLHCLDILLYHPFVMLILNMHQWMHLSVAN